MVIRALVAGFLTMLGFLVVGQMFVQPGPPNAANRFLDYPLMPGVAFMRLIGYTRTHDPEFWVFALLANSFAYAAVFWIAFLFRWRWKKRSRAGEKSRVMPSE